MTDDREPLSPQPKRPPVPVKFSQTDKASKNVFSRATRTHAPNPNSPPVPVANISSQYRHLRLPKAYTPPLPLKYTALNVDTPHSMYRNSTHTSKTDEQTGHFHRLFEPTIILEKVSKHYPDGTVGLLNVSLKLYGNELTCIAGESGHGKSTLLRLLALDDKATTGKVTVLNQDISQLNSHLWDDLRGEAIEYIPQGHLGLVSQTALMNVAHWLRYYDNLPWNQAKTVARQMLREVGLPHDKFDIHIRRLSGGQRARVAIAKAFARSRPICLGDEIFAALDLQSGIDLIRLFRMLAQRGATVAVIVHQEQLREYFDRVLIIRDNRLAEDLRNTNKKQ